MAPSEARVEALRREIAQVAEEFASAAGQALEHALSERVARLIQTEASHFERIGPKAADAFRTAAAQAIARSVGEIANRLREEDLWHQPTVRLEYREQRDRGSWLDESTVESGWITALPQSQLDHPDNRVWILLLNGADALDPIAAEFGLQPSDLSDPGGGHFGLQPQTAGELDPSHALAGLWKRYVRAFVELQQLGRPS